MTHAGQRRVNLIWETTQAIIALAVVMAALGSNTAVALASFHEGKDVTANQLIGLTHLNVICGLVIGFYFSRTNHQAIGGVGFKPQSQYTGR